MLRLLTGVLITGSILTAACTAHKPQTPPLQTVQAVGLTAIQRGINIGNALEAPIPGSWGVEIQPVLFDEIEQAGFDTVRIPVRFSAHAAETPPYLLDEQFMLLVDRIIHQALAKDLTVILDFHHYEEMMRDPVSHSQRFLAIWRQLAERYQHQPDQLYFELLNEPSGQVDAQTWNILLSDAITVIRTSNPNRLLIVGGVNHNHIQSLEALRLPEDSRLMATFHFYEPFEFTHQGAGWVAGSAEWRGTTWSGTLEDKRSIQSQLDQAARWSEQHHVSLVLGEFGVIASADIASRRRWTAFVACETEKRNIAWIYWDLCAEFRVLDCHSLQWDDDLLSSLIRK